MEIIKTGLAAFGMSGQVFHAPFISTNPHFELYKIVERSKELSTIHIMSMPEWLLKLGKM